MDEPNPVAVLAAQDLRVVRELLWSVICKKLKPAEQDEVKRTIGVTLVEENEMLFNEAGALAEILGDVQLSTSALLERQQLCCNPQRRLVEAELKLVMERLRGTASAAPFPGSSVRDRDPEHVVPKSNMKEKAMYDYLNTVAGTSLSGSDMRPRTPTSRPGTASTAGITRPGTASSRCSRPSTASSAGSAGSQSLDPSSVVQSLQGKLNVWDIDAVKEHVRQALRHEQACLHEDIEYLQALLEDEAELQAKASLPPPSIQELKEYGSKLRQVVQEEEQRVEHELRVSRMFAVAEEETSKAGRLRGMVTASRQADVGAPQVLTLHTRPAAAPAPAATHERHTSNSRPASGRSAAEASNPRDEPRSRQYGPSSSTSEGRPASSGLSTSHASTPGAAEVQCGTSPAGKLRPHSPARLRALVSSTKAPAPTSLASAKTPSPLPNTSSPSAAVPLGTGSILMRADTPPLAKPPLPTTASPARASAAAGISSALAGPTPAFQTGHNTSRNITHNLDSEVESMKGGVAAILAKHGFKPASHKPSSPEPPALNEEVPSS
mmetsp:Transcript_20989/g.45972  ORF Transcript_20989/g.45972 Transcript_20989/m.45972 type:complete len:551 (-) Transcript_20989:363-2015(-)